MQKVFGFVKKFWKVLVCILAIIFVFVLIVAIMNNVKGAKVEKYIDGKTFICRDSISDTYAAYSFKDGKIAVEEILTDHNDQKKISGDVTDFANRYKIKASIFSNEIWIMTKYPHGYIRTVAVCMENGVVKKYGYTDLTPQWEITTLDEIEEIRSVILCQHAFSEWVITKEATTNTDGQKERTCSICGKQEVLAFDYTSQILSYLPSIDEFTEKLLSKTDFKIADQSDTVTTYTDTGSLTTYSFIIAKTATNVTYVCERRGETISYDTSLYDNPSLSVILEGTTIYYLDAWADYFLGDYPNRQTVSYLVNNEGKYIDSKTVGLEKTVDGVHYSILRKIMSDSGLATVTANITIP